MNLTEEILAKLDEDIKGVESWLLSVIEVNEEEFFQREIARAKTHLAITKALRRQVEKHKTDDYEYGWDYVVCPECSHALPEGKVESYPCTFIKEVATDLRISE